MRILLVTPPMTQLNTPYPATAYLTAFLRARGFEARQADPALALFLDVFSAAGMQRMIAAMDPDSVSPYACFLREHAAAVVSCVDPVVRFLQGGDPDLAYRIARGGWLPAGPRTVRILNEFVDDSGDPLSWAFGALGLRDRARYLASLFVDDLADAIRDGVDGNFGLARYGEQLAASAPSFDPLHQALEGAPTVIDQILDDITARLVTEHQPDVVGITAPFPGNVYGAFRMARMVRRQRPGTRLILGGGYVNTELRSLSEPRVFDYFDFVTLDDGEAPLLAILGVLQGKAAPARLLRTFVRSGGLVRFESCDDLRDEAFAASVTPTYDGLPLSRYVSLLEMLNPMHRIWSDGRWNKLTLAHGCYWRKCSFCDITLDYIGRYEEQSAGRVVDHMEALIRATGQSGFHFVDEAAPPKMLLAVSQEIIRRGLTVTWWGNIRFEKTFTPKVARILAAAGCIAVSGGLEVASDRLLGLMQKGVTVTQVARVTRALSEAGILVHAYLMYGFPTQTLQETVDALERVRQLFMHGCITSGYWHRFSATTHSPVGRNPENYGISVDRPAPGAFAVNDLPFHDPTGTDHDTLGRGLNKALYNYMHGVALDEDVRMFFEGRVPRPKVARDLIARALEQ